MSINNKDSIPILATPKPAPDAGFNHFRVTRPKSRPKTSPLKKAFLQEMNGARPTYKPAKLYDGGGDLSKEWYVRYSFLNPDTGKYERFKETFDMNRLHDLARRLEYGKQAVKFVDRRLKDGYNPFEEKEMQRKLQLLPESAMPASVGAAPTMVNIPSLSDPQMPAQTVYHREPVLVTVQIVVAKLSRGATKDAQETYRRMEIRWANYVTAKGFQTLTAQEITVDHVKAFKEYLQHESNYARKTINATKSHLGLFWDELKEMKLVTDNPFRAVKGISKRAARRFANKPKDRYTPPTTDELKAIVSHLNGIGMRGFLRFLAMIYYEWVRPEEITKLRVFNIDMKNATINFATHDTKSDKAATIQIVPPMLDLLREMEIDKAPKNYYLFSEDYLPGPYQLTAKYACSNMWRRHVKDKMGTDKNPYALKHKGNIDYVMNNKGGKYDAKWHQMQNRHASLAQTEQYMRDLGVYFVDTEELTFNSFM